jgi:cell division protease FtsH
VLSSGAADDLAKATDIAHDMVTRYGMDEDLGYVALEVRGPQMLEPATGMPLAVRQVSEDTLQHIDGAVRSIVMAGFTRATQILEANRDLLERGAHDLLDQETLDEQAIGALAAQLRRAPA